MRLTAEQCTERVNNWCKARMNRRCPQGHAMASHRVVNGRVVELKQPRCTWCEGGV